MPAVSANSAAATKALPASTAGRDTRSERRLSGYSTTIGPIPTTALMIAVCPSVKSAFSA